MPTIKGKRVPDKELRYEAAVATATPDVIAAPTVYVDQIRIVNTTVGAITITIADGQGTPVKQYEAVSIAANSVAHENFETPKKMVDGLTAVASATGLVISVHGWLNPS